MKKLLSILGAVGLIPLASASAVACGKKAEPETKIDLEAIIEITELGTIYVPEPAKFTEEALVKEIAVKNPETMKNIRAKDLSIIFADNHTSAMIEPRKNSTTLTGSVTVTFKLEKKPTDNDDDKKINLNTVITKTELGVIALQDKQEGVLASRETILAIVNKLNDKTLTLNDVDIWLASTGATIIAKSNGQYAGKVPVKYTLKQDLTAIIINNTDLGIIVVDNINEEPSRKVVLDRINEHFQTEIELKDVDIVAGSERGLVMVSGREKSDYTGTSTLRFTLKQKLESIIKDGTELGELVVDDLNQEPTDTLILEVIAEKYPPLTKNDLEVTEISKTGAVVQTKAVSKYHGKISVRFSLTAAWNGDDITALPLKWDLNAYNARETLKLWISEDKMKQENVKFTDEELSLMIWTGILNADDGENGTAYNDFKTKQLAKHLKFTMTSGNVFFETIVAEYKKGITTIVVPEQLIKNYSLGMKLTKDVISYTRDVATNSVKQFGLQKSAMKFQTQLVINIF